MTDKFVEPLMTPEEVAPLFNVARSTIYSWAHKGILKAIRIGPRLVRFERQVVNKRLEEWKKLTYGQAA